MAHICAPIGRSCGCYLAHQKSSLRSSVFRTKKLSSEKNSLIKYYVVSVLISKLQLSKKVSNVLPDRQNGQRLKKMKIVQ